MRIAQQPVVYKHWTRRERKELVIYSALGFSAKEIARVLDRSELSIRSFSYKYDIALQARTMRDNLTKQLLDELRGAEL